MNTKMKTKLLMIAIALGALTPVFAQLKTTTDGIAASPKARESLNERAAYAPKAAVDKTVVLATKTTAAATKVSCTGYKIAASPRAQATFPLKTTGCCGMSSCVVACTR
jgi:hypothetical protein